MKQPLGALALLATALGCGSVESGSNVKVTNGKQEADFPFVVQMKIDDRGTCTGTFVSDALLLTAAHCVDSAKKVSVNGVTSERTQFFIHPEWPVEGAELKKPRQPQYDSALVRFPAGTFNGPYPKVLKRSPRVGEELTIVGYGNNLIEPFDTFCRLTATTNKDGQCQVAKGERKSGSSYEYKAVFSYSPLKDGQTAAHCTAQDLKSALNEKNIDFTAFVAEQCDGNFRDRSYKETGSGTKRSGVNSVRVVDAGLVQFQGALGGEDTGKNSASGAGDSGGPLFIKDGKELKIAATTHGGSLGEDGGELVKKSTYVDLSSSAVADWLGAVTKANNLNFPDFK